MESMQRKRMLSLVFADRRQSLLMGTGNMLKNSLRNPSFRLTWPTSFRRLACKWWENVYYGLWTLFISPFSHLPPPWLLLLTQARTTVPNPKALQSLCHL